MKLLKYSLLIGLMSLSATALAQAEGTATPLQDYLAPGSAQSTELSPGSIYGSTGGSTALETASLMPTGNLIDSPSFQSGMNVKNACMNPDVDPSCANSPVYRLKNPYNPKAESFFWQMAQWASRSNLPATGVRNGADGDNYQFANGDKSLKIFSDGRTEMSVNAFNELDGKYVEFNLNRKWPHLLVEQSIGTIRTTPPLSDMTRLVFSIDAILKYNDRKIQAGYDKAKHTAQFPIYFTVQNLKEGSPDYGKYVWLGVPVFEDRETMPAQNIMHDDGTRALIYGMPYSMFASESLHSGKWVHLQADILPKAKEAIAEAVRRGYLTSGDLSQYKIGGMNMGFEVTGLNVITVQFKNLSLSTSASSTPGLTPEGFYRLNGGEGIFYSNGKDAYCTFTQWSEFVRWRNGNTDTTDLQNRAYPANMRNDGVCKAASERKMSAPEGFYRILGNTDGGIFYSNGRDAFCVFTSIETYTKWRGHSNTDGLASLALPTGMRDDGACP